MVRPFLRNKTRRLATLTTAGLAAGAVLAIPSAAHADPVIAVDYPASGTTTGSSSNRNVSR